MITSTPTPAAMRVMLLPQARELRLSQDQSILDAALDAGINLPHSCKGGHCGSCKARVVQGSIRYPHGLPLGLSAEEASRGFALLCQARAASATLAIEVRDVRPPVDIQPQSLPCRVEKLERLATNVMAIFLRLPATATFTYLPGQYIDIVLPGQRRRSFSIANAPGSSALIELHIARVDHGEFTRHVFESMRPGALLRMEGPLGQFWFRHDSSRPALLIGGGTGYAPLRAMLESLLPSSARRTFHLYWGVRTIEHLYEQDRLLNWLEQFSTLRYTPVLSEPTDDWRGASGFVHAAVLDEHEDLSGFDVYAAGPPAMIETIRREFTARGLPEERLFFDSFDFAPDVLAHLSQQEPP